MMEVPNDVIKRAAGGDREAFEDIYNLTSSYVYAVAIRVSGNVEDAQEVVQDVFVKVHKNLWKFNFESKLTTWIYRITVNTAVNYYNRTKKRRGHEIGDERILENKGMPANVHAKMEDEDNKRKVELLLQRLNPDQRVCIVLREIEQLSYEEISEVLKVNINTVRTRLKRAREALIKYVSEKEDKDEM